LAQIRCEWGQPQDNFAKMVTFSERAALIGAEWIVFPELTLSGIFKSPRVKEIAEDIDGPSVNAVRRLAQRLQIAIGFGFSERTSGAPLNAYTVVDDKGNLVGVYRKNRLPKLEVPFWQPDNERPVFSIGEMRFGISLCWDNQYPEIPAGYSREGADVVVMPHAWDSDTLDPGGKVIDYNSMEEIYEYHRKTGFYAWKTHREMWSEFVPYIPSLAAANRIWALFVNQTGQPHPSVRFVGPTFVVDPAGRIVAQSADEAEQLVTVDVQTNLGRQSPS